MFENSWNILYGLILLWLMAINNQMYGESVLAFGTFPTFAKRNFSLILKFLIRESFECFVRIWQALCRIFLETGKEKENLHDFQFPATIFRESSYVVRSTQLDTCQDSLHDRLNFFFLHCRSTPPSHQTPMILR